MDEKLYDDLALALLYHMSWKEKSTPEGYSLSWKGFDSTLWTVSGIRAFCPETPETNPSPSRPRAANAPSGSSTDWMRPSEKTPTIFNPHSEITDAWY